MSCTHQACNCIAIFEIAPLEQQVPLPLPSYHQLPLPSSERKHLSNHSRGIDCKPILHCVPTAEILPSNQIAEHAITTY